jgi:hypothetical protein
VEKYSGFSKFNKCTISRKLKIPIELSQGILVVVDSKTGELSLPTGKQLDWFLDKYQYSTSVIIADDKMVENEVIVEPKVEVIEEPRVETRLEVVQEETKVEVKSSGGFWSYFGWN